MPTVAIVAGVKIQFYADEHPPPDFHAVFAEFVAQIRIDPASTLAREAAVPKLRAVLAWASMNREALLDAWAALNAGRKPKRLK